jgi:alkylated DNA repair dioxygenase AlkB
MSQLDMFGKMPENNGEPVILENGEYIYIPSFFDVKTANSYLEAFKHKIIWKQESMNMYGKQVLFPRLTSWYGASDKAYSFSGIKLNPNPWIDELIEIKKMIEPLCEVEFNSVLLNLYRDGNDSISWHTDAEKELGINPIIASVNFGAERKFQIKHNRTLETHDIILKHGSLLIMRGELQHYWKHQVPKQKNITKERINLTFRVIK